MARKLNRIFWCLLVISTAVSARTELPAGVLYPAESVYLNGAEIDSWHAVMTGDVIRTRERAGATLQLARSIALIPPESIVRLEKGRLALDSGTISTTIGKDVRTVLAEGIKITPAADGALSILARDLAIAPASSATTEFDVTRSNGLIVITVHKNKVIVSCGSHNSSVEEGASFPCRCPLRCRTGMT